MSRARPGKGPPGSNSVVYTPKNIQQAYDFSSSATGSGQTIAIIDAYGDPTLLQDVADFDNRFDINSATPNIIYTTDGAPTKTNRNWAIETALDVEWAQASAPGATIDVIVVPDSSFQHLLDGVNYVINHLNVTAISMSWGAPESYYSSGMLSSYETAFQTAIQNWIVLLGTSGDQGADDGTNQPTTHYPGSSPEVIGVGGTTLTLDSHGVYSETAWSGSGGGYSSNYQEPAYQQGANITEPKNLSIPMRGVPDVAFDANPNTGVYVNMNGSWYAVGGTSVGAPNWAAIVADSASVSGPNFGTQFETDSTTSPLTSYLYIMFMEIQTPMGPKCTM